MAKTINIYLLRHGESIQNTGENLELHLPDHAVYLTMRGMSQAQEAGKFFNKYIEENGVNSKEITMFRSPFTRTRQTSTAFNEAVNIGDIIEDDLLVEMDFGFADLMTKSEITQQFPNEVILFNNIRNHCGRFFARRVGGESPFEVVVRQEMFITKLLRMIDSGRVNDNIVIVGHGAQISCLRKAMFNYNYEWYEQEPNPENCSIQHIQIVDGIPKDCGYIYGRNIG